MKIFISCLVLFLGFARIATATPQAAARLRANVQWTSLDQSRLAEFSTRARLSGIKLRTTMGVDQLNSELCWNFAAINMLESDYLTEHREASPETVELSRWLIKEATGSIFTHGTTIEAIYYYAAKIGFVSAADYVSGIPLTTTFRGLVMTPAQLFHEILGSQTFWSYGFSDTLAGWHQHPDPDAKPGTNSYYITPNRKAALLNASLKSGHAVEFTTSGHSLTLYGADFINDDTPAKYYIKDSYSPYFYEASPQRLLPEILEVTSLAGPLFRKP